MSFEDQPLSEDGMAEGLEFCEDFTVEQWQEMTIDWPGITKKLVLDASSADHEDRKSLKEEMEGDVVLSVIFGLSKNAFNRLAQALAANEMLDTLNQAGE